MKPFLTAGIVAGFLCSNLLAATPTSSQGKRIQDLNVISTKVLQRSISPKFYKSLLVSPIDGWIVVRAECINTRLGGARVVRSELGGLYDQLALQFANDLRIIGYFNMENPTSGSPILLHLLVYHTADGTMLLSFPTFDGPGGDQMFYWGCARLAVIKHDGRWVEIEGPDGLHGRGWAVRPAQRYPIPGEMQRSTPPREGKFKATLPPPPPSVLAPIIASSKGEVIVGPSVRER